MKRKLSNDAPAIAINLRSHIIGLTQTILLWRQQYINHTYSFRDCIICFGGVEVRTNILIEHMRDFPTLAAIHRKNSLSL